MRVQNLALIILISALFAACNDEAKKPNILYKEAPTAGVAAKFGDIEISNEELYRGIQQDIYEAESKIYDIKYNRLQSLVVKKLVDSDPRKKGLTNDEFLKKYITSSIKISEKDIQAFIKKRNIPKEHVNDRIKERVKSFLEMEQQKAAVDAWVAKQTKKRPIEIYFKKPARPKFDVVAGDAPSYGNKDAKVTIVEYSDFQCPFCAKGAEIVGQIKKKYGKKVRIVFKNFPLPFHAQAKGAAEASLCANEQSPTKFWELHDLMFAEQSKLSVEDLKVKAKKIGLDATKFNNCLDSHKYAAKVESTIEDGKKVGVKSTPTFYVNGQLVSGAQPIEVFEDIINESL